MTRSSLVLIALACVVIGLLVSGPYWADRGTMRLLIEVFFYLSLAQLWNLLAGYSGLISVGQQAFVGLGGYMLFSLAMFAGLPVLWCIPLAGIATALIAWPTALVAFRLAGPYFAIGTWVIAEVFRLGFAQVPALGGGSGISLPVGMVKAMAANRSARESLTYWIALAVMLAVVTGVWLILRSRIGLALSALRDNEEAAVGVGIRTRPLKFGLYVATAGVTGLIGALIFVQKLRITPEAAFSVTDWTVMVIFMTVIGGIGTLEGPILGCILFFVLREFLSDLGAWYMVILGAVSVGIMLVEPRGLWGLLTRLRPVALLPVARKRKRI